MNKEHEQFVSLITNLSNKVKGNMALTNDEDRLFEYYQSNNWLDNKGNFTEEGLHKLEL